MDRKYPTKILPVEVEDCGQCCFLNGPPVKCNYNGKERLFNMEESKNKFKQWPEWCPLEDTETFLKKYNK